MNRAKAGMTIFADSGDYDAGEKLQGEGVRSMSATADSPWRIFGQRLCGDVGAGWPKNGPDPDFAVERTD
jgi:hypothetical protein